MPKYLLPSTYCVVLAGDSSTISLKGPDGLISTYMYGSSQAVCLSPWK